MKKLFILFFAVNFLSASCIKSPTPKITNPLTNDPSYTTPILVGEKKIFVEIVNTADKMQNGLSNREKISDEQGMLFDFQKPQLVNFWMKDMRFNLDIVWVKNNKIVGVTTNALAPIPNKNFEIRDEDLPVYSSPGQVDMVLEVNAGWAEKNKIKLGDQITILK